MHSYTPLLRSEDLSSNGFAVGSTPLGRSEDLGSNGYAFRSDRCAHMAHQISDLCSRLAFEHTQEVVALRLEIESLKAMLEATSQVRFTEVPSPEEIAVSAHIASLLLGPDEREKICGMDGANQSFTCGDIEGLPERQDKQDGIVTSNGTLHRHGVHEGIDSSDIHVCDKGIAFVSRDELIPIDDAGTIPQHDGETHLAHRTREVERRNMVSISSRVDAIAHPSDVPYATVASGSDGQTDSGNIEYSTNTGLTGWTMGQIDDSISTSGCTSRIHGTRTVRLRERSRTMANKRLSVTIVGAFGLRDADSFMFFGSSDPYCICEIPGKEWLTFRTKVVYNTLHPMWHHEAEIGDFDEEDELVFTIYDHDTAYFSKKKSTGDFLGRCVLKGKMFYDKGTFDGKMKLEESGNNSAQIQLRVHVQGKHRLKDEEDRELVDELLRDAQEAWPVPPEVEEGGRVEVYKEDTENVVVGDALRHDSWLQKFVIVPTSKRRVVWDLLGLLAVGFDFFSVPYSIVFNVNDSFVSMGLGWAVCFYWTADLFSIFLLGFYHEGMVEMRPGMIACRYLKTWFWTDLFLVLFDWAYLSVLLLDGQNGMQGGKLLRTVRSIRAFRSVRMVSMLRLNRLERMVSMLSEVVQVEWLYINIKIGFAILIIIGSNHIIACLWWAVGNMDDNNNWIDRKGYRNEDSIYSYLTSYHWALTQITPASMDVVPGNLPERIFTLIVDLIGLIAFSTFVSGITASMTQLRNLSQARREHDARLRKFCRENRVSLELTKSVQNFANSRRRNSGGRIREADLEIFKHVPEGILQRIHLEVYGHQLVVHPFFQVMKFTGSESFSKLCHTAISTQALLPEQELFMKGTRATGMFFILTGAMVYRRAAEAYQVAMGMWVCEVAMWLELWYHRGTLSTTSKRPADVLGVHGNAFRSIIGEVKPESVLKRFLGCYASRFVRTGGKPKQWALQCSDVWGEWKLQSEIVLYALDRAGLEIKDKEFGRMMMQAKSSSSDARLKHVSRLAADRLATPKGTRALSGISEKSALSGARKTSV